MTDLLLNMVAKAAAQDPEFKSDLAQLQVLQQMSKQQQHSRLACLCVFPVLAVVVLERLLASRVLLARRHGAVLARA